MFNNNLINMLEATVYLLVFYPTQIWEESDSV